MTAAAAPIQLAGVNHYFGAGALRKQILHEISVEIRAGEIVIVTGPSGSGKTTMLTLIGALRSAQEGSVQVLGAELRGASPRVLERVRRDIGYIFQAHNLLDALSATQNVMMSLLLDKVGKREAKKRAEQWLEAVGLGDRAKISYFYKPALCTFRDDNAYKTYDFSMVQTLKNGVADFDIPVSANTTAMGIIATFIEAKQTLNVSRHDANSREYLILKSLTAK